MRKEFTFSIDTRSGYFWIILILIGFILFQYFLSPYVLKLQLENSELKGKNEILKANELKSEQSIKVFKDSLKYIRTDNLALKSKLDKQKNNYKTIIIEKDAKKNTIDSYDRDAIIREFSKRYKQD